MPKKEKVIKRVYEEGRETTLSSNRRKGISTWLPSLDKKSSRVTGKARSKPKKKAVKKTLSKRLRKAVSPLKKLSRTVAKKQPAAARGGKPVRVIPPVFKNRLKPARQMPKRISDTGRDIMPSPADIDKLIEKQNIEFARIHELVTRKDKPQEHIELPHSYGKTCFTLLLKDPFTIYAYWEISESDMETLKKRYSQEDISGARRVLRIFDVTLVDFNGFNANNHFDLDVGSLIGNYYINVWSDNITYIGEMGLIFQNGDFIPLVRSNSIHLPRTGYSHRSEQIWMKVTDIMRSRPFVVSNISFIEHHEPGPMHSGRHEETPAVRAEGSVREIVESDTSHKRLDRTGIKPEEIKEAARIIRTMRRKYDLTEDDIRQYYSRLCPALKDVISGKLAKLARKFGRAPLADDYEMWLDGETDPERAALLKRLPRILLTRRVIKTGASENLVIIGGREELLSSESMPSSHSDFGEDKRKRRDFFFELNTELIVYGRTEPDAEVWRGDERVALRPDGTFSMRFSLPDGKVPLEFRAIPSDKAETRKIYTYVDRNTVYP